MKSIYFKAWQQYSSSFIYNYNQYQKTEIFIDHINGECFKAYQFINTSGYRKLMDRIHHQCQLLRSNCFIFANLPKHILFVKLQVMGCQQSALVHNSFSPAGKQNQQPQSLSSSHCFLQPISVELSGRQIILISSILEKHILFSKLTHNQRMKLIPSMQKFKVQQGKYIFKEETEYAFIIDSGTVLFQLQIDGKRSKKILREGCIFGDLSLINVSKPVGFALAETDCSLIGLSNINFHRIMHELAVEGDQLVFSHINTAPVFRRLTIAQKKSISSHMNEVKLEKGAIIYKQGDFANCIYLVKSGEVSVTFPDNSSLLHNPGDIFGGSALKVFQKRLGEARAECATQCFVINRSKLALCMEAKDMAEIGNCCIIRWALKRIPKFAHLSSNQISQIISGGVFNEIEEGTCIVTAGQKFTKIIVCLEGELQLQNLFKTLDSGQETFGIGTVLVYDYQKIFKSPYAVIKKTKGIIFTIQHAVLRSILHPNSSKVSISRMDESQLDFKNLELVKKIESTLISCKYLVRDKLSKTFCIIHAFNKWQVLEYKREKLLAKDKEINQSLKHRSIINLVRTFKDKNYIFFVYKHYLNFTLDHFIKRIHFPKTETIDFLIMTIINILQFLHKKNILYRDLKPDHIIIESNGYPHIHSFMLAKKMDKVNFKTFTIIGTPHYLAPEVQQGFGYSFPTDYWSLGVITFQLAVGNLPFADDKEDPYDIFLAVQKQKPAFPRSFTNRRLKKFIKLLLNKQSWNRPDHSTIKNCEYFAEVPQNHWQKLEQATVQPPKEIEDVVNLVEHPREEDVQGNFLGFFDQQKDRSARSRSALDLFWDDCF